MLLDPVSCRVCGCTDSNCNCCVANTGMPCFWAEPDLCSACAGQGPSCNGQQIAEQPT